MSERVLNYFKELNEFGPFSDLPVVLKESVDLSYHDLRQLVQIIMNVTNSKELKVLLAEILKVLAILEIMKVPVPTIQKLKTVSPNIFQ